MNLLARATKIFCVFSGDVFQSHPAFLLEFSFLCTSHCPGFLFFPGGDFWGPHSIGSRCLYLRRQGVCLLLQVICFSETAPRLFLSSCKRCSPSVCSFLAFHLHVRAGSSHGRLLHLPGWSAGWFLVWWASPGAGHKCPSAAFVLDCRPLGVVGKVGGGVAGVQNFRLRSQCGMSSPFIVRAQAHPLCRTQCDELQAGWGLLQL